MHRAKAHFIFARLRNIRIFELIILTILLVGFSVFLLRQNNLQMVDLREAVVAADEQGEGVQEALMSLQAYVTSHMNTDLGAGVFLQETYQRDYEAAIQAAVDATNPNAKLYEQVELECRPIFNRTGSFPAYTLCAKEKLSELAPGQDPISQVQVPDSELYRFDFASPLLSLDFTGVLVILTALSLFALALRIVVDITLRLILKKSKNPNF